MKSWRYRQRIHCRLSVCSGVTLLLLMGCALASALSLLGCNARVTGRTKAQQRRLRSLFEAMPAVGWSASSPVIDTAVFTRDEQLIGGRTFTLASEAKPWRSNLHRKRFYTYRHYENGAFVFTLAGAMGKPDDSKITVVLASIGLERRTQEENDLENALTIVPGVVLGRTTTSQVMEVLGPPDLQVPVEGAVSPGAPEYMYTDPDDSDVVVWLRFDEADRIREVYIDLGYQE